MRSAIVNVLRWKMTPLAADLLKERKPESPDVSQFRELATPTREYGLSELRNNNGMPDVLRCTFWDNDNAKRRPVAAI